MFTWLKSRFFYQQLPNILLWMAAAALFCYTSLRAGRLSMTHDECGSWTIWTDFPIFKCYYSPDCWGTANLHWLYVLLMKPSIGMFGNSELAIRLPALLGHLIYLIFSWKLIKSWTNHAWLILFGFILLNINPYMLDFFSLARGYGLALSMMMMSLYFLSRFVQTGKLSTVAGAFGAGVLSVLSNFTLLNYYVCLLAVFLGLLLVHFFRQREKRKALVVWPALVALLITGTMAWLIYRPLGFLMEKGEFEYGANSFWDTFHSLVRNSIYGGRYFHMYNVEVFGGALVVLQVVAFVFSIKRILKNPDGARERFLLVALLLPLLASVAAIIQHYLLGTQYLVNRTALLFIPLCALSVYLFFAFLQELKFRKWKAYMPALIGLFCIVHFFRTYQLDFASEWGYDAETKRMILYLDEKIPEGSKIKLGLHWIYHPSSSYYFKTLGLDFAELPLVYSKDLRTDNYYDYYYVQPSDIPNLLPGYELEKRFSWVGCLMKRKGL
jgi:hypothetical protein